MEVTIEHIDKRLQNLETRATQNNKVGSCFVYRHNCYHNRHKQYIVDCPAYNAIVHLYL